MSFSSMSSSTDICDRSRRPAVEESGVPSVNLTCDADPLRPPSRTGGHGNERAPAGGIAPIGE
eukprot:1456894-Rhodomonas_salina.1